MLLKIFLFHKLKYLIKITTIGIKGLIACLIGQSLPSKLSKIFNVVPRLKQKAKIVKINKTPITSLGEVKLPI